MLEVARARIADPRARWIEADLHAAWRPAETFELGFVVLVLEHLRELDSLAASLAAAVALGGRARILDLHPDRITAGARAHFQEGDVEVAFPSVAHPVEAIRAALERAGFTVASRAWLADDELIAAVPRAAKHRGLPLVLDVEAVRR